jgi:hypothetical protein
MSHDSPVLQLDVSKVQFGFASRRKCKILVRTSKVNTGRPAAGSLVAHSTRSTNQKGRQVCFASLTTAMQPGSNAAAATAGDPLCRDHFDLKIRSPERPLQLTY